MLKESVDLRHFLPELRRGIYKYLPLKKLHEKSYGACQGTQDFESRALSKLKGLDSRIDVMSFDEAKEIYSHEIAQFLQSNTSNPFMKMALNSTESGLFIYVPAGVEVVEPLDLDFVLHEKKGICNCLVKIFVGSRAKISLTSRLLTNQTEAMHNSVVSIELAKNATLDWVNIKHCPKGILACDAFCVKQAAESQFNYTSMTNGSENCYQNIEVELDGERADCNIKGFYTLKGKNEAHVHVNVRHLQESCTSNQFFRGLLQDEARASFRGNVFVDRLAQKTDAYQLCNHLMLGQKTKAIAEPNLEIFADDVKASHGATMKRLDCDDLFYLKSRGIREALASKILARGFCMSAIDHLSEKLKGEAEEFFNDG
jgi:Fe-S cluster assembly protein SufD